MPLIKSSFKPSPLFISGHLATIYSNFFRKNSVNYVRKRIETPDDDFFHIDTIIKPSAKGTLILGVPGLEGSSHSGYMTRLAHDVTGRGYDFISINHRGCGGEPNKLYSSYHSGWTEDLALIIDRYAEKYERIYLVGYSLGGNIVLKYAGQQGAALHPAIKKAVAVSSPVDLKGSAIELRKRKNKIYMNRFLTALKKKTLDKQQKFPGRLRVDAIRKCRNFFDFDNLYTAPAHGFKDAEDYWAKNSARQFLEDIRVPALLLNAKNDPFLSRTCFPVEKAKKSVHFHLEMPQYGGHVAFIGREKRWLEKRILAFLEDTL